MPENSICAGFSVECDFMSKNICFQNAAVSVVECFAFCFETAFL